MQTGERKFLFFEKALIWEIFVTLEIVGKIISLIFTNKLVLWVNSRSRIEELFEEFFESSHSRDELLMLLGFLSFEGFPNEKYCVHVC